MDLFLVINGVHNMLVLTDLAARCPCESKRRGRESEARMAKDGPMPLQGEAAEPRWIADWRVRRRKRKAAAE